MSSAPFKRLTQQETNVLSKVQFDGDLSYGELASKYGFSERTVRKILTDLTAKELIKKTVVINPYKAGLRSILLYFSLRGTTAQQRKLLIQSLVKAPIVTWLAELGGDHQYGCAMQTSTFSTVKVALTNITKQYSSVIREKVVLSQNGLTLFPRHIGENVTAARYSWQEEGEVLKRDSLDMSILSTLSSYGDLSGRAISRMIGVSHTTIENRIQGLKQDGIILGSYYRVFSRKLGLQSFKLLVTFRAFDTHKEKELYKYLSRQSGVVSIVETVGEWDLEIGIDAHRSSDVPPLVYALHEKFDDIIAGTKVIPVLEVHKFVQMPLQEKKG